MGCRATMKKARWQADSNTANTAIVEVEYAGVVL